MATHAVTLRSLTPSLHKHPTRFSLSNFPVDGRVLAYHVYTSNGTIYSPVSVHVGKGRQYICTPIIRLNTTK